MAHNLDETLDLADRVRVPNSKLWERREGLTCNLNINEDVALKFMKVSKARLSY
jgi:DNA polymerase sigma